MFFVVVIVIVSTINSMGDNFSDFLFVSIDEA